MSAVFWGTSDTTISSVGSGVTRYSPVLANAPVLLRTTEAQAQVPIRQAGTLSGLCVRVTAGNRTTACAVTVRKNGADTALTIVPSGVGTYVNDADTVTVASGDLLSYALVGGTGGTSSYIYVAIGVTATLAAHTTRTGTGDDGGMAISGASTATYLGLGGEAVTSATEGNVQIQLHGSGTLKNLAVYVLTNSRTTTTSCTVRKNGANSGIGTGPIAAGGVGLFEDFTSNAIAFADGDLINFRMLPGTGTGTVTVLWIACDLTSTGADVSWHIAGIASGVANSAPTTRYYPPYGRLALSTTEATMQFRPRVIGATATRLGVRLLANTISGAGALTVRFDAADTTQSISVGTGVATGWVEDATPDAASAAITGTTAETLGFTSAGSGSATINLLVTEITGAPSAGAYTLTAEPGVYTVTGATADLRGARTLGATAGAVALTGASAGLPVTRTLVAVPGLYAVTGAALTARRASLLTALPGALAVTGADALLSASLLATPGVYGSTGAAAALAHGRSLTATAGAAAVAGSPADLRRSLRLIATAGLHAVVGADAILFAGGVVAPLSAVAGAYTVTGTPATLQGARRLDEATAGTYAVTGAPATLQGARTLTALPGAYAVTGSPAALRVAWQVLASAGLYPLTGSAAALTASRQLVALPAAYALTGALATVQPGGVAALEGSAGLYALAGAPATFLAARHLVTEAGLYAVTGALAGLQKGRVLLAEAGVYGVDGTPAELRGAHRLAGAPGLYLLAGAPATLTSSLEGLPPAFAFVRFTSETLRGPVWTGATLRSPQFAVEVMEGSI